MHLPNILDSAISQVLDEKGWKSILEARKELTDRYRNKKKFFITKQEHRLAYIATRMPATYAAVKRVLEELSFRCPLNLNSLLDLGAGPGTVLWAAHEIFPHLEKFTMMEKDTELMALGKKFEESNPQFEKKEITWQQVDLTTLNVLPKHDLITLSYSVGELSPEKISILINQCWEAAEKFLVIIEPGTPEGFERIRAIRKQLIEMQASMVAPCPHMLECPMLGGNWCHFAERVERSSIHRRLKEGSLGHEDEKFSYVIFSKEPVLLPAARILRHPLKKSGHVNLNLCTPDGLKDVTVSKRAPELYKEARKAEWGDAFSCYQISK